MRIIETAWYIPDIDQIAITFLHRDGHMIILKDAIVGPMPESLVKSDWIKIGEL